MSRVDPSLGSTAEVAELAVVTTLALMLELTSHGETFQVRLALLSHTAMWSAMIGVKVAIGR